MAETHYCQMETLKESRERGSQRCLLSWEKPDIPANWKQGPVDLKSGDDVLMDGEQKQKELPRREHKQL